MHRSLLFKLGIIPFVFLVWGWLDTIHHYTYAGCETAGHHLTAYHACSRIYVEFSSGASPGWPRNFGFFRQKDFDGKTAFSISGGYFPSPAFQYEVPDIPFEQLSEEDSFRAEVGDSSGSITIPYWLVFLTYIIAWLGLSRLAMRKLGSGASALTTDTHGKISP